MAHKILPAAPSAGCFFPEWKGTNHRAISLLFFMWSGGLRWPLGATVLLPPCQEFKALFHQGKSLSSCDNGAAHRPFFIRHVHSVSPRDVRWRVRRSGVANTLCPFRPPFYAALMDDNVPTRGPVTVTGRQQDNVVTECRVKGRVWSREGPLPSSSRQHSGTCGKLLRCWGREAGGGKKKKKNQQRPVEWDSQKTLTLLLTLRNGFHSHDVASGHFYM